jgi:AraC-like DNA-binding protein
MNSHVSPYVYSVLMSAVETVDEDDAKAVSLIREAKRLMDIRSQETRGASALDVPAGLARWQMKKIDAYLERHLAQSIVVADLAAEIGLCVSHFTRLFRASYGVSPYHHVLLRRVEAAKRRLQISNAPLSEVALDCGLADQSHFTRVFRRFTGVTPSGWRRLSRSHKTAS